MLDFLTTFQVAEALNVQPKAVREWIRDGKLPAYKVGKSWLIRESELIAFVRAHASGAVEQ
jgi:excisionase family DNA binding protein